MASFFRPSNRRSRPDSGTGIHSFTLPEVVITLAILLLIMVAVLQFVTQIDQVWKEGARDPFAEAQDAFATMSETVAAATLETYQDEADVNGAFRTNSASLFSPDHPARRSDLDFVTGPGAGTNGLLMSSGRITTGSSLFFVAPRGYSQTYVHTGMERLLNVLGYFVEFGNDDTTPAFIVSGANLWRWRLKQVLQPAESLQIYAPAASQAWIQQAVQAGTSTPVLAENVITLIVLPERAANDSGTPLATNFCYDSRDATNPLTRHQLPPRVRLVLVAIDEASAQILASRNGTNPPPLVASTLFQASTNLDTDLAALDGTLTAQKIGHRIFQREIQLPSAAWSETQSQ